MTTDYYKCISDSCNWNSKRGNPSVPRMINGKPYCGKCSAPTSKLKAISKKLSKAIWRGDDERLKGPPEVEDDIKVRFDIVERSVTGRSPEGEIDVPIAEIRFQIWDERLRDVTRLKGSNEVPWCLMKNDNPAMLIRGKHYERASMGPNSSNWVYKPPELYLSNELANKVFTESQYAAYLYGYQARRSYVLTTETRLVKLAQTKAKRNRLYDRLRAEHIRAFALVLKRLKEQSHIP